MLWCFYLIRTVFWVAYFFDYVTLSQIYYYAMVVCRLHDTARGLHIRTHTDKIQTHGHVTVFMHESTQSSSQIISKLKCCFHHYFIYIQIYNKTIA